MKTILKQVTLLHLGGSRNGSLGRLVFILDKLNLWNIRCAMEWLTLFSFHCTDIDNAIEERIRLLRDDKLQENKHNENELVKEEGNFKIKEKLKWFHCDNKYWGLDFDVKQKCWERFPAWSFYLYFVSDDQGRCWRQFNEISSIEKGCYKRIHKTCNISWSRFVFLSGFVLQQAGIINHYREEWSFLCHLW